MERFKFIKEADIKKTFEDLPANFQNVAQDVWKWLDDHGLRMSAEEPNNKEWFKIGETAYVNFTPEMINHNVELALTEDVKREEQKEVEDFINAMNGKKVKIIDVIDRAQNQLYSRPEEVLVEEENGKLLKFPTKALTHQPPTTNKQVKAADDTGAYLILKRKHGSSYWQYYTEVFSVSDFNLRFEDSVFDYYTDENAEDILRCENWEDVDNVLNTVESSAQDADFWLLKVIEENSDYETDEDTDYTFLCEDVYGKQIKVKFEGYPGNGSYAEIV